MSRLEQVVGKTTKYAATAGERAADVVERATPVVVEVRDRVGPQLGQAVVTAKEWAGPRIDDAREWAAPRVVEVRERVAPALEDAVEHAREWAEPRLAQAVELVEPVIEEARARGEAAVAALKGEALVPVVPVKRRRSRLKVAALVVGLAGAGAAVYKALAGRKEEDLWTPATPSSWTPPAPGAAGGTPDTGTSSDAATEPTTTAAEGLTAETAGLAVDPLATGDAGGVGASGGLEPPEPVTGLVTEPLSGEGLGAEEHVTSEDLEAGKPDTPSGT